MIKFYVDEEENLVFEGEVERKLKIQTFTDVNDHQLHATIYFSNGHIFGALRAPEWSGSPGIWTVRPSFYFPEHVKEFVTWGGYKEYSEWIEYSADFEWVGYNNRYYINYSKGDWV